MLALPFLGRAAAGELQQGLAVELFLGGKVPIKATARQACFGHDRVDGDLGETLSVEQLPRAVQDSLAGFSPVLGFIRHKALLRHLKQRMPQKMFLNIFCGWRHSIGTGALFCGSHGKLHESATVARKGSP